MAEQQNILSHNELGRELELFDTFEEAGSGHIFWKPRGYKIYANLLKWSEFEHRKRGYLPIRTPMIYKSTLWEISGHKEMYKDFMYLFEINKEDMKEEWGIKPMNCPAHILVYKSKRRFEHELPLKLFEFGFVHRHELSGVLNGLLRVRSFTQDDSHFFAKKEQVGEIVKEVLRFVDYTFELFGLKDRKFYLSTMPEKHLGDERIWKEIEQMMEQAMKELGLNYELNPGDGAFYGPKIDVEVKDNFGRYWQLSTIQIDFNLPERFDVNYYKESGEKERVVMVHRAIFGSVERFIGILLEHFQGRLPLLFAPYQVMVIPIKTDDKELVDYALKIKHEIERMSSLMIEVDVNLKQGSLSKKILHAEKSKYIHVIVVGRKELEQNQISLRLGNETKTLSLEEYYAMIDTEIKKWFNYDAQ